MAEHGRPFDKIQIIWNHSSILLKAVVTVLIVFSIAAMAALGWVQMSIQRQTDEMRAEAAALEDKTEQMEQRMDSIDSVQTIQDIAKEELGLVTPDTIIIQPQ